MYDGWIQETILISIMNYHVLFPVSIAVIGPTNKEGSVGRVLTSNIKDDNL